MASLPEETTIRVLIGGYTLNNLCDIVFRLSAVKVDRLAPGINFINRYQLNNAVHVFVCVSLS